MYDFKERVGALAHLLRHGFCSQNLQGSSQASATPVPGYMVPSSDFHVHQACTWYTYTDTLKKIHIK